MAQRSDELKQEISQTREQMAETADALAYKADVSTRTKDWVGEKKDAIVSTVTGVSSKVGDVTPDGAEVTQRWVNRMKRLAERNPVGLAIGGAAVGFLAGVLLPSTRMEDERIGPMADDVKATAAEAGAKLWIAGRKSCRKLARQQSRPRRNAVERRGRSCPRASEKAREAAPGKGGDNLSVIAYRQQRSRNLRPGALLGGWHDRGQPPTNGRPLALPRRRQRRSARYPGVGPKIAATRKLDADVWESRPAAKT